MPTQWNLLRCKNPVIDVLPEQKKRKISAATCVLGGKEIRNQSVASSRDFMNNQTNWGRLRFRHRYEVDPNTLPR